MVNTKFSKLTSKELYGEIVRRINKEILGVKELKRHEFSMCEEQ